MLSMYKKPCKKLQNGFKQTHWLRSKVHWYLHTYIPIMLPYSDLSGEIYKGYQEIVSIAFCVIA